VPDEGRARHHDYLIELPKERSQYPALPWTCAGARMINVYFEVLKAPLLDRLPPEFCRTSPPYCRLTIIDHPQSPAGPFRDAAIALGCRLNMMPAAFVAASITDNEKVLAAGIFERGFPNLSGKIEFESSVGQARAMVSDAKGPLLEVVLPTLQTIEPSRMAYDHADSLKTSADGKMQLSIAKPDLKIERAAICKNARIEYPEDRADTAWQALRCRNVVSAQLVHGTRTFDAGHPPG
jgi:hypothetical protein